MVWSILSAVVKWKEAGQAFRLLQEQGEVAKETESLVDFVGLKAGFRAIVSRKGFSIVDAQRPNIFAKTSRGRRNMKCTTIEQDAIDRIFMSSILYLVDMQKQLNIIFDQVKPCSSSTA